jgi:hypothetical protein
MKDGRRPHGGTGVGSLNSESKTLDDAGRKPAVLQEQGVQILLNVSVRARVASPCHLLCDHTTPGRLQE